MRAIRWASGFDAVWSGLVFDPRGEMTSGWNDAPMEEKPIALSSKTGLRHAALPRKIRSAWVHRASGANAGRIFLASYGFTPRTNASLSSFVNPTGALPALFRTILHRIRDLITEASEATTAASCESRLPGAGIQGAINLRAGCAV